MVRCESASIRASTQPAALYSTLITNHGLTPKFYRYQRGSIAITTNQGIASWPAVLAGDEVLAGAILDRLLHCATVLNIQGRSYRLRDLEAELSKASQVVPPDPSTNNEKISKPPGGL